MEALALAFARAVNKYLPGHVDEDVVTAGALLHEIGTARTAGLQYVAVGATMASEIRLDSRLVEVIRRHKGEGMGPEEAALVGLPLHEVTPRTEEESIVSLADILVTGQRRRLIKDVVRSIRQAGHPEYAKRLKHRYGRLESMAGRDLEELGPVAEGYESRGRLLVVEDEASWRLRKSHHNRSGGLVIGFLILGVVSMIALISVEETMKEEHEGLFVVLSWLSVLPIFTFMGWGKSINHTYYDSKPFMVYEMGIAYADIKGRYLFRSWPDFISYYYHDNRVMGRVLSVGRSMVRLDVPMTMKGIRVLEWLVRRNLVPE